MLNMESVFVSVYHKGLKNWVVQATLIYTDDFQDIDLGLELILSDYIQTID